MARPGLQGALARLGATGIRSVAQLGELFGLFVVVEHPDYQLLSSLYDLCIAACKAQVSVPPSPG
jgi:hypothetical protein